MPNNWNRSWSHENNEFVLDVCSTDENDDSSVLIINRLIYYTYLDWLKLCLDKLEAGMITANVYGDSAQFKWLPPKHRRPNVLLRSFWPGDSRPPRFQTRLTPLRKITLFSSSWELVIGSGFRVSLVIKDLLKMSHIEAHFERFGAEFSAAETPRHN